MSEYRLFGADVSLYTGKARAYLRYKDIPFEEVVASAEVYQKIIVPRTGVRFIPVIISPDDVAVQDTTEIIDFLEERFPEPSVYPDTPLQKLAALLFEVYGDEWLLIPAMYYRWWFREDNYEFIVSEFGRTSMPDGTPEAKRKAGEGVAGFFGGSLPVLGVTERNREAIEAWYEEFLDLFSRHLNDHPFLLGTRPSIGDFGLMGPLYAHLYRDPYPGKLMKERAPLVAGWVERMNAPEPRSGGFLPGDEVPETLWPILEMMFREHFPVLLDTAERLADWLEQNPGKDIPRVIGMHEFKIRGVIEKRAVFPYTLWMFQRPVDFYNSLDGADRERVDGYLKEHGGYKGMQVKIRRRVKRVNNILVPE
jgi:glutathione S-transferase